MIGHDLVDLSLARQAHGWKRDGFLAKIFTPTELSVVLSGEDLFTSLWWFWSQKEAVYKIVNRSSGRRWFNPHAFQITCFETESTVWFEGEKFKVRTHRQDDKIESVSVAENIDFKCISNIDLNDICKVGELPFFKDKHGEMHPASVSHHGKYASAYALLNA